MVNRNGCYASASASALVIFILSAPSVCLHCTLIVPVFEMNTEVQMVWFNRTLLDLPPPLLLLLFLLWFLLIPMLEGSCLTTPHHVHVLPPLQLLLAPTKYNNRSCLERILVFFSCCSERHPVFIPASLRAYFLVETRRRRSVAFSLITRLTTHQARSTTALPFALPTASH